MCFTEPYDPIFRISTATSTEIQSIPTAGSNVEDEVLGVVYTDCAIDSTEVDGDNESSSASCYNEMEISSLRVANTVIDYSPSSLSAEMKATPVDRDIESSSSSIDENITLLPDEIEAILIDTDSDTIESSFLSPANDILSPPSEDTEVPRSTAIRVFLNDIETEVTEVSTNINYSLNTFLITIYNISVLSLLMLIFYSLFLCRISGKILKICLVT